MADLTKSERSAFVAAENRAFIAAYGPTAIAMSRTYRCECGFRCGGPGEMYDHATGCVLTPAGLAALDDGEAP